MHIGVCCLIRPHPETYLGLSGSVSDRASKSTRGPHPLSLELHIDAVRVGAPYVEFAARLCKLHVRQNEPASILIASKANKPTTSPCGILDVVPRPTLKMWVKK